jgi:hypothetical protein
MWLSKWVVHAAGIAIIGLIIFGFIEPFWLCAYIVATLVFNILSIYQKHSVTAKTLDSPTSHNLSDSSLSNSK